MFSFSKFLKAVNKFPVVTKKQGITNFKSSFMYFSSLATDSSEPKKMAFSQKHNIQPKDLESQLMTCKSLNGR